MLRQLVAVLALVSAVVLSAPVLDVQYCSATQPQCPHGSACCVANAELAPYGSCCPAEDCRTNYTIAGPVNFCATPSNTSQVFFRTTMGPTVFNLTLASAEGKRSIVPSYQWDASLRYNTAELTALEQRLGITVHETGVPNPKSARCEFNTAGPISGPPTCNSYMSLITMHCRCDNFPRGALNQAAEPSPTAAAADKPCCQGKCKTAGEEKYWSIASSIFGTKHCGECCMDPKDYKLYHFFEKNLTHSDTPTPCHDFGYAKYDTTVTHGFGPVKMTLDLYDLP